jgi:radical SAM superfamily enzyme YgiQ (UPF0313 family)
MILLLSTYELGRQPFGLASPAAWLREQGFEVRCRDLSRQSLDEEEVWRAQLIGFYLPMHTATRLAVPVITRVRLSNPSVPICAFGLYAPLNEAYLRSVGVSTVLDGEFEADLLALALGQPVDSSSARSLPRLAFRAPDRGGLPPLSAYASLQVGTERRVVGYTEATRGCKHRCRHCPIVPVYNGQFRVVPHDVVMADIAQQVEAGAEHITFGDPDFFNAPRPALELCRAVHEQFPALTFDVTIKVEHLLRHARHLRELQACGCLFVTSAVESLDDEVLGRLEKGHTRADFVEAVRRCRDAGVTLSPTFVAFTPWTTREGYQQLLETLEALDLIEQVAPIQLTIRLLITAGSRLLELEEVQRLVQPFDPATLSYPWAHPDPEMDALQDEVMALVGRRMTQGRREIFEAIRELARSPTGPGTLTTPPHHQPMRSRAAVPYLNEPWYC